MRRLGAVVLAAITLQPVVTIPATASRSLTTSTNDMNEEGPTSDFVALYYKLYWQSQALASESSSSAADADAAVLARDVPDDIAEVLNSFSLSFDTLPSLLQRAVLWDAGYVQSATNDGELATILTDCERASTMAEIAPSADEMADTICSTLTCSATSSSSTGSWTTSRECASIERLESLAKCASTSVGAAANPDVASIWSTGNGPLMKRNVAPSLFIWRHDAVAGSADSMLAIHSTSEAELPQTNVTGASAMSDQVCAAASTLIIPCVPYTASSSARWCRPQSSPLLMRWLREYADALGLDATDQTNPNASGSDSSNGGASEQDESGVVINPEFQFDGRSSDLAQQFYRRHIAGDQAATLTLASLPEDVEKRLNAFALQFSELPSLLQRALLWDSGYALDDHGTLAKIYSECGLAMNDLMISTAEVQDAGCITQTCESHSSSSNISQGDDTAHFWRRAVRCNGYHMLVTTTHCAVSIVGGDGSTAGASTMASSTPIWADGGSEDMLPNVRVRRWLSADPDRNESQAILALHLTNSSTTGEGDDVNCASHPEMIIPCATYAVESTVRWCRPTPGALVTSWLQRVAQPAQEARSSSQIWYVVVIPIVIIVVLVLAAFGLRYRSVLLYRVFIRRRRSTDLGQALHHADKTSSSTTALAPESSGLPSPEAEFIGAFSDPFPAMVPNATAGLGNDTAGGWMDLINSMKLLLESPHVCDSVIAFQDLKFHHLVGRGSCGEVWLCFLYDQRVAAKRLLKRRRKRTSGALETFTNEILLTASLRHPHIVRFLGVTSSTLHSLWLVTDYMENGDLHHCLQSFGAQLSWRREKLQIAIGIARGLCYLHHDLSPAVIHCNLKTRNVLLTSTLEAKLTDFSVSRRRSSDDDDGSRTTSERSDVSRGTDTPYWSAPEVLQSREYSEKADMYSLGVVLCELDTLQHPYADAKSADLPSLQLLQRIADGLVKPKLSVGCPPPVAELIASCLERDPSRRPSVVDALDVLVALPGISLDTFSF